MSDQPRAINCPLNQLIIAGFSVFLCFCSNVFSVELPTSKRVAGAVMCRKGIDRERREELVTKLKKISGWPDLAFDAEGILRQGSGEPVGGSQSARELLAHILLGTTTIVLEDASRRSEIVFMRVIPGRWKATHGPPAFVVQIDFADFDKVIGDPLALQAFDAGWGLLHELDHIAHNSLDATSLGETGECEKRINQMRLECNLPQRTEYFYTLSPLTRDTTSTARLVRLAFEQSQPGSAQKRRYWVLWDANLVGGVEQNEVAALR